jgi:hypothetical protein
LLAAGLVIRRLEGVLGLRRWRISVSMARSAWQSGAPAHTSLTSSVVGLVRSSRWGTFGAFVAAFVSIPVAGALRVIVRELWQATAGVVYATNDPNVSQT